MRHVDLRGQAAASRFRRGRVPVERTRGLAPKSVKNVHRILHRAFSDAVAWQYMSMNPAEHASVPRDRAGRPEPAPAVDARRAGGVAPRRAHRQVRRDVGTRRDDRHAAFRAGRRRAGTCSTWSTGRSSSRTRGWSSTARRTTPTARPRTAAEPSRSTRSPSPRCASTSSMLDRERSAFGASYPDHGKLMVLRGRPPTAPGYDHVPVQPPGRPGRSPAYPAARRPPHLCDARPRPRRQREDRHRPARPRQREPSRSRSTRTSRRATIGPPRR